MNVFAASRTSVDKKRELSSSGLRGPREVCGDACRSGDSGKHAPNPSRGTRWDESVIHHASAAVVAVHSGLRVCAWQRPRFVLETPGKDDGSATLCVALLALQVCAIHQEISVSPLSAERGIFPPAKVLASQTHICLPLKKHSRLPNSCCSPDQTGIEHPSCNMLQGQLDNTH
ncbi:hypothetical protein NQZ68_010869 [Dissostichus eleginoides]|nr:hypothetical protein NQZ68_010869 [Dissostichus eleginoides]